MPLLGQGRPLIASFLNFVRTGILNRSVLLRLPGIRCALGLLILAVSVLAIAEVSAQGTLRRGFTRFENVSAPLQRVRIRMVWGGGAATAWQGSLVISNGRFENVTALGFESDSGASLHAEGNELKIQPVRKADFAGFDVDLVGNKSDELLLTLVAPELGLGIERQLINLSPLFKPNGQNESLQIPLDDSGNRLDINWAPGDRLPITIDREHLIFDPGETFEFNLRRFRGTVDSNHNSSLQVEVFAEGETQSLHEVTVPLQREGKYLSAQSPIQFPVPKKEGVYEARLTLKNETLITRLNFNRQKLTREVQFVVIDPQVTETNDAPEQIVLWNEVYNSDETRGPWIDKIPGVPQIRSVSSGSNKNPLRNEGVTGETDEGKTWTRFTPGGWQAIPLQVGELGKPHIIDIEFLDDGPMAVGISVLQPDSSGQIDPFGIDSGISISDRQKNQQPTVRRHRIFFWPEHKRPYLLFANRHAQRSASIGTVRVLAGPDQLAASGIKDEATRSLPSGRRQFLSFYEKPLFAENFAAPKSFDSTTEQSWHTWQTFLVGAKRWTQYLKANGYTAAMLVVAGDGSSLYPSQKLQPNPRYDSGIFSPQGTDPMRKDIVELLLRIFEREGLQLVPVFHFNAPIPALEKLRMSGGEGSESLTLVDVQGESRIGTLRDASSSVSIYNPLDPTVQAAFSEVIREFVERYRGHARAMGGLGFLYSQDALQVLPGQSWGGDAATLRRFQADSGITTDGESDWFTRLLNSQNRDVWLSWRQQKMAGWLDELKGMCESTGPLYLLGGNLLETQDAFSALAPSLRRSGDMPDALSRIGLPVEQVARDPGIVFLNPEELSPEKTLPEKRLNIQLTQTADVRNVFREFTNTGTLFSHRYSWAEFDQLKDRRIFGNLQQQAPMRLQPLTPVGFWHRQHLARSIADHDSQFLVEGGWLTGFGQEEHLLPLVEVFTQLPNVRFSEVPEVDTNQPQVGVVMRQSLVGDQNWFYAVNPTPWPLVCRMELSGQNTVLESLQGELRFEDSETPVVLIELEPFSLQAGFTSASVTVTGFQVELPAEVMSSLQDRLNALLPLVSQAAEAEAIGVLDNPGFEAIGVSPDGPQKFGWSYDNRNREAITLKRENVAAGETCLSMISDGPATWVRSNDFSAPETGRLSVSVLIRSDEPSANPLLRISLLGDDGRHVYYRYGSLDGQSRKITSEWQEFAVHFDDLPLNQSQGRLQIGFDLMGAGHVDIDQVRVFDRWLDGQDSRALTQLLALAGYQLSDKQNVNRCRRILDSYWPRFLEEFFEDSESEAEVTGAPARNRSARVPDLTPKSEK